MALFCKNSGYWFSFFQIGDKGTAFIGVNTKNLIILSIMFVQIMSFLRNHFLVQDWLLNYQV